MVILYSQNLSYIEGAARFEVSRYCARVQHLISKYDKQGNLVRVYKNLQEAIQLDNIVKYDLLRQLQGKSLGFINGFIYLRGDGPNLIDVSLLHEWKGGKKSRSMRKDFYVLQYSALGKLMAVYNNVEEAASISYYSKVTILNSIENRELSGKCFWVQKKLQQKKADVENPIEHELSTI